MALSDFFSFNTRNNPAPAATPAAAPASTSVKTAPASTTPPLATSATTETAPNGTVPAGSEQSPLAEFNDLWLPTPVKEGDKPAEKRKTTDKYLDIDPSKVHETARKLDFTKVVSQELLAKAAAGGAEGVQAMMEAMNSMAQHLYAQSSLTSANLVENSLQQAGTRFNDLVPDMIKKHAVSDTLRTENPIFTNPAAAPMLSMLEAQFTAKYPDATVNEIKESAKRYMQEFANAINPPAKTAAQKEADGGTDWMAFAEQN